MVTGSSKIQKIVLSTVLVAGALIMCIPFVWMILTSFKTEAEALLVPPTFFPQNPTFKHYTELFLNLKFFTYLINTLVIVVFSFLGLLLNSMAGYAFAKYKFPGKNILFVAVLATMMIPSQVTMIPNYILLNKLKLTGSMLGIILPGLAGAFAIFLFKQFMSGIPEELLEAARLEGAGEFAIFFKIIMPVARPIFAVQGILTFIGAWNSFLWPLIMANDESLYTLSVGLSLLKGQNVTNFALQMAGASFMVLPVMIVFVIFQKHIIEGFTISGMK